jgi:hypothetical protein
MTLWQFALVFIGQLVMLYTVVILLCVATH